MWWLAPPIQLRQEIPLEGIVSGAIHNRQPGATIVRLVEWLQVQRYREQAESLLSVQPDISLPAHSDPSGGTDRRQVEVVKVVAKQFIDH